MEQKQEVRKIRLGERRRGICVTDANGMEWHFRFDERFVVIPDKNHPSEVLLLSGERRFRLVNMRDYWIDGAPKHSSSVYIEIYGRMFLFKPFLRMPWLRELLHYHGE